MKSILKQSLKILSLGTLMFASCKQIMAQYGVPIDIFKNRTIKVLTRNNVPIKGLEVNVYSRYDTITQLTDSTGTAKFEIEYETPVINIKDLDGEDNQGKFVRKDTVLFRREEPLTIIMKEEK